MKRIRLYILLGAEFAALMALVCFTERYPSLFSSLLAFPFEQLGMLLRALALRGRLGNALALALWAGLCMLPLFPALRHRGDRSRMPECSALALLSLSLVFVLTGMVNPLLFDFVFPELGGGLLSAAKAIMGSVVWSMVALWAVLRLLRLFRAGDTRQLLGYLRTLLYALCILFTGVIALSCGTALVNKLGDAPGALDKAMAAARFLVEALPYALDIAVTLSALTLLELLLHGDAAAPGQAAKLSRLCCLSLGVTAAAVAGMDLIQLALAQRLSDIAVTIHIPVMSLAFTLTALLASRLIAENQRLKNDNDLFI